MELRDRSCATRARSKMAAPFPHHLDAYLGKTERQKLRSTLVKLNPLPAGKDLFAQGQQTTNFFIIAKGTADVYVHGVRVRTLVAGSVCGELAAMSGNALSGALPDLSALRSVVSVDLSNNQLSGRLPDLSGLASLQTIDLSNNQHATAPTEPEALA